MQPIAVYEERQSERRARFDLFSDTIRVSGSTLQAKVDQTIPLARLHPSVTRVWVYSLWFYVGFWVLLAGVVLLIVVGVVTELQRTTDIPVKQMGMAGTLVAAGAVLAVLNRHKTEYAQFQSDAGLPVLGIARAGRGASGFDPFIALLTEQIRVARAQAGVGVPPANSGATDA